MQVVVAEDEPLARKLVRAYLSTHDDTDLVAECATGDALARALTEAPVDLLILDINMPGRDVFEALATAGIDGSQRPYVVFTTAYDKYAIRAFETNAVDFLLKPFSEMRFATALARVRSRFQSSVPAQPITQLIEDLGRRPKRLLVPSGTGFVPILVADIDWIRAERDYSRLYVEGRTYLLSRSLTELESKLDPDRFARIHRSAIVNIDRIREVKPQGSRRYKVTLHDGTVLVLSRTRAEMLRGWKI